MGLKAWNGSTKIPSIVILWIEDIWSFIFATTHKLHLQSEISLALRYWALEPTDHLQSTVVSASLAGLSWSFGVSDGSLVHFETLLQEGLQSSRTARGSGGGLGGRVRVLRRDWCGSWLLLIILQNLVQFSLIYRETSDAPGLKTDKTINFVQHVGGNLGKAQSPQSLHRNAKRTGKRTLYTCIRYY